MEHIKIKLKMPSLSAFASALIQKQRCLKESVLKFSYLNLDDPCCFLGHLSLSLRDAGSGNVEGREEEGTIASICYASGIVLWTAPIFFYSMLTKALQCQHYQPHNSFIHLKTTFVIQLPDILSLSGSCKNPEWVKWTHTGGTAREKAWKLCWPWRGPSEFGLDSVGLGAGSLQDFVMNLLWIINIQKVCES